MYLLVEKGEVYEPYTCMVLYSNKQNAIKDLKNRANIVRKDFYEVNDEIIDDIDYFYANAENSTRYIEISILELEEGKETCL